MNRTQTKPVTATGIGDWVRNNTNILLMFALIPVLVRISKKNDKQKPGP